MTVFSKFLAECGHAVTENALWLGVGVGFGLTAQFGDTLYGCHLGPGVGVRLQVLPCFHLQLFHQLVGHICFLRKDSRITFQIFWIQLNKTYPLHFHEFIIQPRAFSTSHSLCDILKQTIDSN